MRLVLGDFIRVMDLAMVDAALAGDRMIGIVQPAADGVAGLSAPDGTNLYRIGCVGRIRAFQETDDGHYMIELRGLSRFTIAEAVSYTHLTLPTSDLV